MANYCTNEVTFTHDNPHKLEEMVNIFRNGKPFNQLIPEPDWLKIPNENGDLPEKEVVKLSTGENISLLKWPKNNKPDDRWHSWRREHWGCRQDISDVEIDYQLAGNIVHMTFVTPWSPPDAIYEKLCEMGYEFMQWQWDVEELPDSGDLVPLEVVA